MGLRREVALVFAGTSSGAGVGAVASGVGTVAACSGKEDAGVGSIATGFGSGAETGRGFGFDMALATGFAIGVGGTTGVGGWSGWSKGCGCGLGVTNVIVTSLDGRRVDVAGAGRWNHSHKERCNNSEIATSKP